MQYEGRYGVKEVVSTLYGEGLRAGARSVVVRFSGCNLWDGHPLRRDEGPGACARWCDADFYQGVVLDTDALLGRMDEAWTPGAVEGARWCVLTGGEPLLQVDPPLVRALKARGWRVAVETNGTIESPVLPHVDHLCVSPKRGAELRVRAAHELKVVLPGAALGEPGWTDAELVALAARGSWGACFVQPQDVSLGDGPPGLTVLRGDASGDEAVDAALGEVFAAHLARAIRFVTTHPTWRLSAQVHKLVGLP